MRERYVKSQRHTVQVSRMSTTQIRFLARRWTTSTTWMRLPSCSAVMFPSCASFSARRRASLSTCSSVGEQWRNDANTHTFKARTTPTTFVCAARTRGRVHTPASTAPWSVCESHSTNVQSTRIRCVSKQQENNTHSTTAQGLAIAPSRAIPRPRPFVDYSAVRNDWRFLCAAKSLLRGRMVELSRVYKGKSLQIHSLFGFMTVSCTTFAISGIIMVLLGFWYDVAVLT